MKYLKMKKIKCLLLGYLGNNNTGCESRLLTIAEDIRQTVGTRVEMTAAVTRKKTVLRYINSEVMKSDDIKLVEYSHFYFFDLFRIIPKYDLLVLVEAATFTDHFSDFLLYEFLWASLIAKLFRKKIVAYAVDCGPLKPFNQKLVKLFANKIDLLITRTMDAKEKLKNFGVTNEIIVTTDTAFQYKLPKEAYTEKLLKKLEINPGKPLIGLAPKEFFLYPITLKLFGRKENLFKYPYYHNLGKENKKKSKYIIEIFARYADYCIETYNANILIFAMEHVDFRTSKNIYDLMQHKDCAKLVSADEYTADDIICLLSKLKFLVSTRYHACVFSMQSSIPMIAISHDMRCESLFKELGMSKFYIAHTIPNLYDTVVERTRELVKNESQIKNIISNSFPEFLNRCLYNRVVFKSWFNKIFL